MEPSPGTDAPGAPAVDAPSIAAEPIDPSAPAPDALAPPPSYPTPAPPRRRGLGIIIAAIVVVVLVVLVLLFSGLLGVHSIGGIPLPGAGTSSASAETFQAAYASANQSAQVESGGPWYLVDAAGYDSPSITSFHLFGPPGSGPCNSISQPTLENEPTADIQSGISANWLFGFVSSGGADLTVAVIGGAASNLGSTPASDDCLGTGTVGHLPAAGTIEDSSAAVAQLGSNFTEFMARFPTGGISVLLLSDEGGEIGEVSGTAVWAFDVSPCLTNYSSDDFFAPGDPAYLGGVNATSHQVLLDLSSPGIGSCVTPGTLSNDFALGPGTETAPPAGSGWAWAFNIGESSGGLLFGDMTPEYVPALLTGPLGASVPSSALSLTVIGVTGEPVASYNFTTANWTMGGNAPVEAGETIEFVANSDLTGNSLVFVGVPPFTGEVAVDLP